MYDLCVKTLRVSKNTQRRLSGWRSSLPPLGREIGARWWSKVRRPRWAQDLEKDLWIGQKKKLNFETCRKHPKWWNLDKCDLLVFERTAVGALEVHFLVPKRFGTSPAIVFAVDVPSYSWNSSAVRIVNSNVWCKWFSSDTSIMIFRWIYHEFTMIIISMGLQIGSLWCFPNRGCHPSRPSTPLPPHPVIGSELRPQKIISKKYGFVWKWLVPHCTQSGFADHYPY